MIVLDASVLIAFLDAGNVHHDSARDVVALPDDFGVHALTLAETLVGGVRAGRADEMATVIAAVGVHELERLPAEPRTLAQLRVETGLKLPDCCVLALAEGHGATLATYDRRLARVARDRGCDVVGAS